MQTGNQTSVTLTPELRHEIEQIVDDRMKDVHVRREDFSELKAVVSDLAQAQQRTETRVEELAEAQQRTEARIEELAEAQQRTEARMEAGFSSLQDQIAALGGRWGIYNEGTFRSTIRGLLSRTEGVEVREGEYGGRQVDVIIRNGEHVLLEITSRMHAADIDRLYRSADDYRQREGVEPTLMVATSYVSPRLMERIMGLERRIEIFSYEGGDGG